ncbi:MAG TPA: PorV/PorQ family protein [Melioribacteraceae bacterium]|nr:PorV/PorQ family protein [Melioribacteraceae bacterium]
MKKTVIIALILFINVFTSAQSFVSDVSKRGTSAASFLSIGQGARAAGMGSAYVGVSNDPTSLYWNPAGIAKQEGAAIVVDHTRWIADVKYNFIAATYNLGSMGSLGLSLISSDIGEMDVTTIEEPEGTGETYTAQDFAVSIAYAINLTDNFSIGFNPKFVHQKIWRMSATSFAVDLGVQYITPFDGIVLAASMSNFGSKMKMEGNSSLVLYDPDNTTVGNNGNIPAYLETEEWELPLLFRVGIAYQPIKNETHALIVALDASHPSDDYESLNAGFEYTFDEFLSLRAGYKSLLLKDSEESYTFGFGIQQRLVGNILLKVDYAYGDFGRLKEIQKFSLGIAF